MDNDFSVKKECEKEVEHFKAEQDEKNNEKVEDVLEQYQDECEQLQKAEFNDKDVQNVEKESVSSLKQALEEKTREIDELMNRFVRLQADFDNYKKRMVKERQEISVYILEDIVSQLLPVVDNFERALDSAENNGENDSLLNGLNMILKQFKDFLEKNGIKEIEAEEKEFDPRFHDAVMQEETDKYPSNTIIEVLQKGYILSNKVIRPSMVKVAK